MTVGEKIKFARTLADVTQKELASLTGISEEQIKQYEINTRVPRKEKLESIASALGISKAFFINHNIEDETQIMFMLYEMQIQTEFGVKVIEIENNYGIIFEDNIVNELLEELYEKQEAVKSGEISKLDFKWWQLTYPSESNQKPKQIKYKNFKAEFKKLEAEQAKLKEEQTQISVILNLIADKFSHCKNINEVAEAVQDIKTLTRN